MLASVSRPVTQPQRFGRLWWLPSGGISNGIDDDAWAPILDVTAEQVTPLLAALRDGWRAGLCRSHPRSGDELSDSGWAAAPMPGRRKR